MKIDRKDARTGKSWVGLGLALGCMTLLALPLMAADPEPAAANAGAAGPATAGAAAATTEPAGAANAASAGSEAAKQEPPKPEVLYREGLEAIKVNDLVASVGLFRSAAVAGHVPSMVKLAEALDRSGENESALEWFEKAAKAGNPEGALGLGQLLISGGYGSERVKEGVDWIRKAADQRFGPAMVILSGVISSKRFVDQPDQGAALKLLNDAADMGYLPAMKELVKVYSNGALGQKVDPVMVRTLESKIQKAVVATGAKP
ncbi:MAG: sel1 repeat family protein [Magnetococcales bacterium]|nr:sel1 repeat family protein [Magnetococcales bacterium]MBF0151636.1 sel1 repeat family protein [Magnetococcales bacterium]MBF0171898.1 sel1 repeat family protein [Magnetococcales bacterium]MBF0346048.1 sel1 repeat family protein [Magnetococcales bacterium]MBF0632648.1 sel1 repeat family protein [Magnetococcales bacterium]